MNLVFLYYNPDTQKYIVQVSHKHSWKESNELWQESTLIGKYPLVPHVDLAEKEEMVFDTEKEAIMEVAKQYARQLLVHLIENI